MLSSEDVRLIGYLHGGFPLSDRPFAEVAAAIGSNEDAVIERLRHLLAHGDLTRFGPLFQIERAGGRFVLAAMAVPEERFETVAAQLAMMPEVAHNYRRESARASGTVGTDLNMWFVLAVESADQMAPALRRIELATGLTVLDFPKEKEFFVELRLPLVEGEPHGA